MPKLKIVCMGDSLTEGYGIEQEYRWSDLLSNELNIEIINSGISGDTTAGMLSRFSYMVIDHKPTHVVIMGGTNDLFCHLTDEQIISNIMAMTRHARHHNIIPIIGIPTPYFPEELPEEEKWIYDGHDFIQRIETFQERLKQFALEDDFKIIDFSAGLTPQHFLADGIHPNEMGNEIMKDNAKAIISKLQ